MAIGYTSKSTFVKINGSFVWLPETNINRLNFLQENASKRQRDDGDEDDEGAEES